MKHFIALVLLVSACNLSAQDVSPTQKGNLMIGGSGTLNYSLEIGEASSGYFNSGLSPSIGWFLSDGLALGVGPTIGVGGGSGWDVTILTGGLNIFLVKYFDNGVFVRGSTGYSIGHTFTSSDYGNDYNRHFINLIPEVGYAFFLGPNVALELSLTNTFSFRSYNESSSFHSISGVSAGFQIFL